MRGAALLNGFALSWVAVAYGMALWSPERGADLLPFTSDAYAYDLSMQAGHLLDSVGRPEEAAAHYSNSLRWDPRSAPNWLLLAAAEERQGNAALSWTALEQAIRYEPRNSDVLWMRANYLLRAHRENEAISDFQSLLKITRRFDESVFLILARMRGVAASARLLPDDREIHTAFLRHALGSAEPVKDLPLRIDTGGLATADIERWCLRLLNEGAGEQAWEHWSDWVRRHTGATPNQTVRNGGFEKEFTAAPFDWLLTRQPSVRVFRDATEPRTGSASLQLNFGGHKNFDGVLAEQWTLLRPLNRYTLSFWWKARGLTTDSAPEMQVSDADFGLTLAARSSEPGSWQWRQQHISFETGKTGMVRIALHRKASMRLAGEIAGSLWVDDVQLTPQ